jgi:hypothetical protein
LSFVPQNTSTGTGRPELQFVGWRMPDTRPTAAIWSPIWQARMADMMPPLEMPAE